MRKVMIIGILTLIYFNNYMFAQTSSNERIIEYVPGEIIIRIIDEEVVKIGKTDIQSFVSIRSIDSILTTYKAISIVKLIKDAQPQTNRQNFKTLSGYQFETPSLHNIYRICLSDTTQLIQKIEAIRKDPNVIYAEPNYIFYIDGNQTGNNLSLISSPNDSLYNQQWHIQAIKADSVWITTTGDTSKIISILDTGVDLLHPDLAGKIWFNLAELNGIAGVDDDLNGFIDDFYGWDFINNDNIPLDDNSHGTHVAGISAAATNNSIGIAGIDWKAKIMPIKVFQSSGRGDAATITQGIIYAMQKGATVINMSFGGYSRSYTMEAVLANAYATSVLVAAAGNDAFCIGPGVGCAPFFPAALSYVLGVQATKQNGNLADFSNFDQDGPIFSKYSDLLNYELIAPGENILSTIPQGKYRLMNGTSMATPIVSAAATLYKTVYPNDSQELMWGNFINTTSQHLNLHAAINVNPSPMLSYISTTIVDTLDGDRDGRIDAGETIELWYRVRNTWGKSDSVFVGIRFGEFEDTSLAQIITPVAFIGSISSYATRTNETDPLKIYFKPGISNDRDIVFEKLMWSGSSMDTVKESFIVTVENGTELSGILDTTLTLTSDRLWLVLQSFRVGNTGTLIIKPGTTVKIGGGVFLNLRGKVIAKGTPDSMITFTSMNGVGAGFWRTFTPASPDTFSYCRFVNMGNPLGDGDVAPGSFIVDHCLFEDITFATQTNTLLLISGIKELTNSVIRYISGSNAPFGTKGLTRMEKNTFYKTNWYWNFWSNLDYVVVQNNNFVSNTSGITGPNPIYNAAFHLTRTNSNIQNNNIISNRHFLASVGTEDQIILQNQYWGRNSNGHKNQTWDFYDDANLPMFSVNPVLTQPSGSAQAIVWKVLVNGKDPQEETLDPLGVGKHRIQVYFNKPMDTSRLPSVTFGVREPYTQNLIQDSVSWSPDSTIWSALFYVRISTGDGINRIRIAGARDTEDFEIPVEETRFEFLIDAAGSASAGFVAIPGQQSVRLEWRIPEISDLLGFNMYRFSNLTDTTYSDTTLINVALITDTTYTDYDVIGGVRYYYFYRIVRTNLSETDQSGTVSVIPLIVGVPNEMSSSPEKYTLSENYPNPFNPRTQITYEIPKESKVLIQIFDLLGKEVTRLVDEKKQSGCYHVQWHAENHSSGIYICRMIAGEFVKTRKLILLK